jgi:general secretion pathway protein G
MAGGTVLDYAARARGWRWNLTLKEWAIVCAILAVIGVVVIPRFTSHGDPTPRSRATQQVATLQAALDAFRKDTGRYPTAEEGLAALFRRPPGLRQWYGPYVVRPAFCDPWGNAYVYAAPAAGSRRPVVTSAGADGKAGTGDDVVATSP